MEAKTWMHWLAIVPFGYIFCKAGFSKILKVEEMVEGMRQIGFGIQPTLIIGWAEVLGLVGLIAGIWFPAVKLVSILLLWIFSISALAIHISYHHPIEELKEALIVTILPLLILATDRHIKLEIVN
jgi:uncharacterized membrane protein YphA (DoxX/SURF4 family)